MRDPAENKDLVPGTAYYGNRPGAERSWLEALRLIKEIRDRARLLSLTRDGIDYTDHQRVFGCCWARPRTWEQYADAHRGACLVFDRKELEGALMTELSTQGQVYLGEVDYTPAGPADSGAAHMIMDERIFSDETREQAISDYLHGQQADLFFLKAEDWASEREFRALLLDAQDEYAFASYGTALRTVLVGEHFPRWQLAGAREVCEQAGVELRQALWMPQGRPYAARVADVGGQTHV